ncbi:FMN-dependent NADH-azoreductase [Thermoactinomyces mirandus]|uniref:FMN dependent NADH:quinone oxidoreductase n=1 Tax=Thermoactinomyces mirandus TaxID=2756294 RepID=A0A7W1XPW9_9BACL|nr:FMN-dependent NADH-azoreductase [Thermoactinomyces mirandus]MBA4600850.1 FMN-dependent NADH-azoreductase [Thermoactinomyces mirandus]
MATLLYVTANPKPESESVSLQVGRAFLSAYELANPFDEIEKVDVYQDDIPLLDGNVFNAWAKLSESLPLSLSERKKLTRINQLVDQFVEADKYVFVTPMWNFGLPPMFKAYIDLICMSGKTFRYTEQGPVGLMVGKKAIHIQARGGIYSHGNARIMEYGDSYVRMILGFIGIDQVQSIIAEGTSDPKQYQDIINQAKKLAQRTAVQFARQ